MLLIDVSLGKTKVNDVGELSKRLNARVFSHENYYVCLLTGTCAEEYDSRTQLGIEDFLVERNFYAGLSYGFFNIVNISIGYKQSVAIEIFLHVKRSTLLRVCGQHCDVSCENQCELRRIYHGKPVPSKRV